METPSNGMLSGNSSSLLFTRILISPDRFNYLKSPLVGTAQHVVAGLALTSANYEKAAELLQQDLEIDK